MEFNPASHTADTENEVKRPNFKRDKSVRSTRRFPTFVAGAALSTLLFTGCGSADKTAPTQSHSPTPRYL